MGQQRSTQVQPSLDGTCSRRSICCAAISPSMICSVKFFDPTMTLAERLHETAEHAESTTSTSSVRFLSVNAESPAGALRQPSMHRPKGHQRSRNGSGQNLDCVHRGEPAENQNSETARADCRRNGGGPDGGNNGCS